MTAPASIFLVRCVEAPSVVVLRGWRPAAGDLIGWALSSNDTKRWVCAHGGDACTMWGWASGVAARDAVNGAARLEPLSKRFPGARFEVVEFREVVP